MSSKQEKKKQNELNLLKYINPALEYIFQSIIKSRINNVSDENLTINYSVQNKNKLVDLINYQNSKTPHNFEYNIYICFCKDNKKYSDFIAENWKFKINTTNSELNELSDENKNALLKKLHTFSRSIQSLQCLLPLHELKNEKKSNFKIKIYKESNINIDLEDEIKDEKKAITIELKEDKFINIQLTINYCTRLGIVTHQYNLESALKYNEFNTLFKIAEQKSNSNLNDESKETNINSINNDNNNNDNNELRTDFSRLFDNNEADELLLSTVIQKSMIEKDEVLNTEDIKQIKKEINYKKNLNLETLYSSCFNNTDDIKIKNLDEILDVSTLLNKEINLLNSLKYNYNIGSQNRMIDELYEEMDGIEIKDLIRYPPKKNMMMNNDKTKKENEKDNLSFKNLLDDYYDIKQILNNKN